ncbi:glutathionylspermidine synthase, partial [Thraustotheca clavata]
PSTIDGSNISRVKQTSRLPLSTLKDHGVAHAELPGVQWFEDNRNAYYEQTYWNDEAAYKMSSQDARVLRDATFSLHAMCLEAVKLVVESDYLMDVFEIPHNLRGAVRKSFERGDPDLLGRFDFSWDGRGPPKLLEYNADTPTVLVETAVGQRLWQEHVLDKQDNKQAWCFNDIESQLHKAWERVVGNGKTLYLAGTDATVEEKEHLAFVCQSAMKAGIRAKKIMMSDLTVNAKGQIVEYQTPDESIPYLWKLYPYEWLADELFGSMLWPENGSTLKYDTKIIEPAWKLILGNKTLLALLWEMYPNHPNLLPATYDRDDIRKGLMPDNVVAKPKYGREGAGVTYSKDFESTDTFLAEAELGSTMTTYSDSDQEQLYLGEPIYQSYHDTGRFMGRKIVIGSWVIHGKPCGFNFREDNAETTNDNSCFVPHYIDGEKIGEVSPSILTATQSSLMKTFYGNLFENENETTRYRTHTGSSGSGLYSWFFGGGSGSTNSNTTQAQPNVANAKSKAQEYSARNGASMRAKRAAARASRSGVSKTGRQGGRVAGTRGGRASS